MLAFKLMAIFAVAYAQMASGVSSPERKNHGEIFAFDLKMKMVKASSSGGIEKIPNEMINSGSDGGEPQKSATVNTAASEMPSPTQQTTTEEETTTEVEVTTVELETVTLPTACPADYEAFWVSDYSEAEKQFFVRLNEPNPEECCQKFEQNTLKYWAERSFSLEDGLCTLYTYAPVNRSAIGPPPRKDGDDKILYVKRTPTDQCSGEFDGETIYVHEFMYTYRPSAGSELCSRFACVENEVEKFEGDRLSFGDDKCLNYAPDISLERMAEDYIAGRPLFNIFTESDELTFASYNWSQFMEYYDIPHLHVDVVYDSAVDEYRWRQSLRPIPDNSPLWAPGYPSNWRYPCVGVFPQGLQDTACHVPGSAYVNYLTVEKQFHHSG